MGYGTLLVHLDLGRGNEGMLAVAADLAGRFGAAVVGIGACQPMRIEGDGYVSGAVIEQDRSEIEREMYAAEGEFRGAFGLHSEGSSWRSMVTTRPLSDYLAGEARCADLVVVSAAAGVHPDPSRRVDLGALVMQAGRPVLVVPEGVRVALLQHVVIGWNDSREIRRAVRDAMPVLRQASTVTVVAIADADRLSEASVQLTDVAAWLARHGVTATVVTLSSDGADATSLDRFARDRGADVIVAGAYGHSRLREWALGGVTRDLLLHGERCSLLSH